MSAHRRLPSERLQTGAKLAEAMAAAVRELEAQIRSAGVATASPNWTATAVTNAAMITVALKQGGGSAKPSQFFLGM